MVIWEKKLGELHHPHPNPVASLHGSRFIAFCSSNFVDELWNIPFISASPWNSMKSPWDLCVFP
jgi:hypothetical protein